MRHLRFPSSKSSTCFRYLCRQCQQHSREHRALAIALHMFSHIKSRSLHGSGSSTKGQRSLVRTQRLVTLGQSPGTSEWAAVTARASDHVWKPTLTPQASPCPLPLGTLPCAPGCQQPPPRSGSPWGPCRAGSCPLHSPWSCTPPGWFCYCISATLALGGIDQVSSFAPVEPRPLIPLTRPQDVNVPVVTSAELVMFFFVLMGAANTSFRISSKINNCCFLIFPRLLGKGLQGPA